MKVILTPGASDFVGKVSLAALSGNPVYDLFTDETSGEWHNHVELGLWADLFLIAPLTANTMAKMANGNCDNLLMATYLSARCPVMVAPAMDLDMWIHPSTKRSLSTLISDGVLVLEPTDGPLASGLSGKGRMMEPEAIFKEIHLFFSKVQDLSGKKVLVSLGPTVEPIDPVRFISNHSSGKMGAAICQELTERGAKVTAICGPISEHLVVKADNIIRVKTAEEMLEACTSVFPKVNWAIMAAAVADYTPVQVASQKIKKSDNHLQIELKKTPDIASILGQKKQDGQILIGFALETENENQHAMEKMNRKNFDAIVLNSLNDPGAGFGVETNKITILSKKKPPVSFETKTKKEVAKDIIQYVVQNFSSH